MRRALASTFLACCAGVAPALAGEAEAARNRFLAEAFGAPPPAQELVLVGPLRPAVRAILGHDYPSTRLSYWRDGERSAWILDEIGKEMPITVGIVIADDVIDRVRVLVYRESRGGEVRHPRFTAQFAGARLTEDQGLDRSIDGIAGATLSVRALQRLSRLALALHRESRAAAGPR